MLIVSFVVILLLIIQTTVAFLIFRLLIKIRNGQDEKKQCD